jgi:uncharacterized protein
VHTPDIILLSALMFAAATIYTSVGHAGASGYIAAMALFGLTPAVMKPTALTLNILVATLATYRWNGNGLVSWRALWPLVIISIPLAFIGGTLQIPAQWYRLMIGIILLAAAAKLFFQPRENTTAPLIPAHIPIIPGAITGGFVGFLSGLTGTGGGIFLSPLLLFFGWAGPRQASGITVPFILINSLAGLAGNLYALRSLPSELPYFMIAALLGALVGTQIGIHWVSQRTLQRVLGVVLFIAAVKFIAV